MKIYSCKIRLNGSLHNEVRKFDATAAEIALLRILHGGQENVIDILHTGNVNRADRRERERLAETYHHTTPNGYISGPELVLKYFGAPGMPLPQEVEFIDPKAEIEPEEMTAAEDETIVPIAEPVAVRSKRIERHKVVETVTGASLTE